MFDFFTVFVKLGTFLIDVIPSGYVLLYTQDHRGVELHKLRLIQLYFLIIYYIHKRKDTKKLFFLMVRPIKSDLHIGLIHTY